MSRKSPQRIGRSADTPSVRHSTALEYRLGPNKEICSEALAGVGRGVLAISIGLTRPRDDCDRVELSRQRRRP